MTRIVVMGIGDYGAAEDAPNGEWHPGREPRRYASLTRSVIPAVTELVGELGRLADGHVHGRQAWTDLTSGEIDALWREAKSTAEQALVVHFAGHAGSQQNKRLLYLAGVDAEPDRLRDTGVELTAMLDDVDDVGHRTDSPSVLFLLDTCGAGQAVNYQVLQRLKAADRRSWVIAAAADDEAAFGARFTRACTKALSRMRRGVLDLSASVEYVPVETLAAEIDRELARLCAEDDRPYQTVLCTPVAEVRRTPPPFFVNPAHRTAASSLFRSRVQAGLAEFATAVVEGLDPVHFLTRAEGSPHLGREQTAVRCFFSGRENELRRIKRWLALGGGDSGRGRDLRNNLLLVTGAPGMGKSALLGVVACLSHPQLRQIAGTVRSAMPRHLRLEENPRLVCVHARQRTAQQVWKCIVDQLPLSDMNRAEFVAYGSDILEKAALFLPSPFIVLMDALDEAIRPEEVVEDVLLPMLDCRFPVAADDGTVRWLPAFRMLLGTRPQWDRFGALREIAAEQNGLLDLDACDPAQVREDLALYLDDLLEDGPLYSGERMRGVRQELVTAVAERLASMTTHGPFLLGGLFAHSLNQLPAALDAAKALEQLPLTLPGLLRLNIDADSNLAVPWARHVLTAVGHARGEGMPLELITACARALYETQDPDPAVPAPGFDDVRDLLASAAFYFRHSVDEDSRQLYRFFHQSLIDYFTGQGESAGGAEAAATVGKAKTVADALLATVPTRRAHGVSARSWDLALPYLRRHALEHAESAGHTLELLEDLDYLIHEVPPPGRTRAFTTRAPASSPLLRAVSPGPQLGGTADAPADRRCRLALAARHLGHDDIVERVAATTPVSQLSHLVPSWTRGPLLDSDVAVEGDDEGAGVVGQLPSPGPLRVHHLARTRDPRLVLCDGTQLELRDLPTGAVVSTLPIGSARLLTVHEETGHALAATARGPRVDVWNLLTSDHLCTLALEADVTTARMWRLDTDLLLCAASTDGRICTYTLADGACAPRIRDITDHGGRGRPLNTPQDLDTVRAVLPVPGLDGLFLILKQNLLYVWDLARGAAGTSIDLPDDAGILRESTCCAVTAAFDTELVAVADDGYRISLFDLRSAKSLGRPWRLPRKATSLAVSAHGLTAVMGTAIASFAWGPGLEQAVRDTGPR
ncbi:hypothetical protein [Streptomyces sp. PA5.6]|uniref:hypothetical protein n=1 Tax=Streptomyces sp. PA5.6 TaxID=3035651 RepID=UPI0039048B3F